jgi:hypothetical protein
MHLLNKITILNNVLQNLIFNEYQGGTRYRAWLRHNATSQTIEGLIPDEVLGSVQFTYSF